MEKSLEKCDSNNEDGGKTNTKFLAKICCALITVNMALVAGGLVGWFTAKNEYHVKSWIQDLLNLAEDEVAGANDKLTSVLQDVTSDGKYDPSTDTTWLEEPIYYTNSLVTLNEEQEQRYLSEFGIIYRPVDEFLKLNETDDVVIKDIPDNHINTTATDSNTTQHIRRRRATIFSSICPSTISGVTQLVAFADGSGSAQLVQLNNHVQWVFNEECRRDECIGIGCYCRRVQREEKALVYPISMGKLQGEPVEKIVRVHSCRAVIDFKRIKGRIGREMNKYMRYNSGG